MKAPKKSETSTEARELYSLDVKSLWKGFKQEHASFWFLCIYFFFEYVRPQTLYPAIDVLPWVQIFLLFTIITALTNQSTVWAKNPINKLFIFFSIIILLSGIFAFDPRYSWDYMEAMLGWIIVYFLVINIVNSEKLIILFITAYLLFNLKMAQFGARHWIERGFSFTDYGLTGSPGWFQNSGEYAIQMLIYGSLAIAFVVSLRDYWSKSKKLILYIAASLGYLAVMGASSRGSQLGLGVIGVWFLLKHRNGFKGLVFLAVISIGLYYLLPEEQVQRFRNMGEDNSSLQRLAYVDAGIEAIKEHPVLGIGYNNWINYMWYKHPQGVGPGHTIQQAHNIYIQAASELGLFGLFIFLLMALFAFINNSRTRRMAKELDNKLFYNLAYGLDAGLIGYLIAGTFVTVLYYPFFWVQLAMIVMLNTVISKQWSTVAGNLSKKSAAQTQKFFTK